IAVGVGIRDDESPGDLKQSSDVLLQLSLINGGVRVALEEGVGARFEDDETVFRSTAGATFQLEMRPEGAHVDAIRGVVDTESTYQREFVVLRVETDPLTNRPTKVLTGNAALTAKFKSREVRKISFQVKRRDPVSGRLIPAGPGRRVVAELLTP